MRLTDNLLFLFLEHEKIFPWLGGMANDSIENWTGQLLPGIWHLKNDITFFSFSLEYLQDFLLTMQVLLFWGFC